MATFHVWTMATFHVWTMASLVLGPLAWMALSGDSGLLYRVLCLLYRRGLLLRQWSTLEVRVCCTERGLPYTQGPTVHVRVKCLRKWTAVPVVVFIKLGSSCAGQFVWLQPWWPVPQTATGQLLTSAPADTVTLPVWPHISLGQMFVCVGQRQRTVTLPVWPHISLRQMFVSVGQRQRTVTLPVWPHISLGPVFVSVGQIRQRSWAQGVNCFEGGKGRRCIPADSVCSTPPPPQHPPSLPFLWSVEEDGGAWEKGGGGGGLGRSYTLWHNYLVIRCKTYHMCIVLFWCFQVSVHVGLSQIDWRQWSVACDGGIFMRRRILTDL